MDLVFMGTPTFALPTMEAILGSHHRILAVYCQPDKPAGRGLPQHHPPVACCADDLFLPLHQPKTLKKESVREEVRALNPPALVVVAYGKILPPDILAIPTLGCVNLHPSLLPRYRGASPIQSALANGESTTGITTMFMDEGMDTGPLLLQRSWTITEEDTGETLSDKLSKAGADLVVETLNALEKGELTPTPQDENKATLCRPLTREDGRIEWTAPARTIYNRFRAYLPWPGSFTTFRNKLFKVHWLVPIDHNSPDAAPGTILSVSREGIRVSTGEGAVIITHVQIEGKKRVSALDFAHGHHVEPGERFQSTS